MVLGSCLARAAPRGRRQRLAESPAGRNRRARRVISLIVGRERHGLGEHRHLRASHRGRGRRRTCASARRRCSRKPSSPTDFCHFSVKRAVEERGSAVLGQLVELDAHRQRDAVAEGDRLALAERGQELEQARAGVGDRRRDDLLVAIVRHAQREHGVALGQDGRIDLGRALRDDAQRGAVLAAFLGDLGDGALARLEAEVGDWRARSGALPRTPASPAPGPRSTARSRRSCGRAPRRRR